MFAFVWGQYGMGVVIMGVAALARVRAPRYHGRAPCILANAATSDAGTRRSGERSYFGSSLGGPLEESDS